MRKTNVILGLLAVAAASSGFGRDRGAFSPPSDQILARAGIDKTYEGHASFTIAGQPTMYSMAVDAEVELPVATSMVRIIMIDSLKREHLVYEAYPLISGPGQATIEQACEETCVLDGVKAESLRIQVENARINLRSVSWAKSMAELDESVVTQGVGAVAAEFKRRQDQEKVEHLNANIKANGLRWTAGHTSVSAMTYAQKKELFKSLEFVPAMQGFEFYRSGIFDLAAGAPVPESVRRRAMDPEAPAPVQNFKPGMVLPEAWDWRNAHGENWVTPVKNQASCGSCWAFGVLGSLESVINLYYNQRLDIDLAEQDLVSCANIGGCSGALPDRAARFVMERGTPDEGCFNYQARQLSCSSKCSDWQARSWKVTSYAVPATDDDSFKATIFNKGPFAIGIYSWSHEMVAVGYSVDGGSSSGSTKWIIKNSWGQNWGEQGYVTMTISRGDRGWNVYTEQPYFVADPTTHSIACNDKDEDGYCFWGLSEAKPESCAATCSEKKDCNDADAAVGMCAESR